MSKKGSQPDDSRDRGRGRMRKARRLLEGLGGARLCYGEPVVAGDRTVIPVARVRTAFGFGFGDNETAKGGGGGGGGGYVDAAPIGFIELSPAGSRFQAIEDPESTAKAIRAGAGAIATVLTTVAGVRALRARSASRALPSPKRLLGR